MKEYKILIIDDEPEIINFIIDVMELEETKYTFYRALNGVDGIRIAEKFLPDLIVTDWEMPQMSGIELIRNLKSGPITSDIPVVMITGAMTSSGHLKTALEAGAIDFIRKPIDAIELTARLGSMLLLSDYYKETVNLKNRELVSIAVNIMQNNEFNLKVLNGINEINTEFGLLNKNLEKKLQSLSHDISLKIKGESWLHFEAYFKNVHPRFFEKLALQFPNLTPAEIKLAAFLRLNLTTKEIASITFITPGSIKTARNRLRKKLGLPFDENLNVFLMSL
jgi:DNA-binding response OmpR family regulator